jgi:carboxymethylenebutenolidase
MSEQSNLSRRDLTAMSIAAGLTAASDARAAGAHDVLDTDVEVKTQHGTCDAALVHPKSQGRWPAAILFVDAFGLRPTMRDMAKRLAQDGYVVLVPNPYYRSARAPGLPAGFDFNNPADRKKLAELRAPLTADAVTGDAIAYTAFLDANAPVKKSAKMGVFGYCMGGAMTLRAAAALPERVGAGASFHGGGLATDQPDSPHRLVPKIKAQYYFGVAANDDASDPQAKTKLEQAFADAHLNAKIEVYDGSLHGWCVSDMPHAPDGKPIYDEAQAERAWNELVVLFKRAAV